MPDCGGALRLARHTGDTPDSRKPRLTPEIVGAVQKWCGGIGHAVQINIAR